MRNENGPTPCHSGSDSKAHCPDKHAIGREDDHRSVIASDESTRLFDTSPMLLYIPSVPDRRCPCCYNTWLPRSRNTQSGYECKRACTASYTTVYMGKALRLRSYFTVLHGSVIRAYFLVSYTVQYASIRSSCTQRLRLYTERLHLYTERLHLCTERLHL